MRAHLTVYGFRDSVHRLHKLSRQLARFSGPGEELGRDLSRERTILLHQIERKLSLPATGAKPSNKPIPSLIKFIAKDLER